MTLSKGFYLGIHTVTQAQWKAVMEQSELFKGDDLPVERVSWDECLEFCKKLNKREGTEYRLPTEAEWEYACRAGTTTPFYFGETIGTDQVNYNGDHLYGCGKKGKYRRQTTPWAASRQMTGDSSICTATSRNGAMIGSISTLP